MLLGPIPAFVFANVGVGVVNINDVIRRSNRLDLSVYVFMLFYLRCL